MRVTEGCATSHQPMHVPLVCESTLCHRQRLRCSACCHPNSWQSASIGFGLILISSLSRLGQRSRHIRDRGRDAHVTAALFSRLVRRKGMGHIPLPLVGRDSSRQVAERCFHHGSGKRPCDCSGSAADEHTERIPPLEAGACLAPHPDGRGFGHAAQAGRRGRKCVYAKDRHSGKCKGDPHFFSLVCAICHPDDEIRLRRARL